MKSNALGDWKFKGDSRYTGSDSEDDDFNDFTMNNDFNDLGLYSV